MPAGRVRDADPDPGRPRPPPGGWTGDATARRDEVDRDVAGCVAGSVRRSCPDLPDPAGAERRRRPGPGTAAGQRGALPDPGPVDGDDPDRRAPPVRRRARRVGQRDGVGDRHRLDHGVTGATFQLDQRAGGAHPAAHARECGHDDEHDDRAGGAPGGRSRPGGGPAAAPRRDPEPRASAEHDRGGVGRRHHPSGAERTTEQRRRGPPAERSRAHRRRTVPRPAPPSHLSAR